MNAVIKNPFERKQEGRVTVLNSNFLKLALAVSVMFMLEACAKEAMLEPIGITMTTKASEVKIYVAGAEDITIDWGDGKKSNLNDGTLLSSGLFELSHSYSGTTMHNIVITGDVTRLNCSNNQLTTLDVSRNMKLTYLNCAVNQLTTLDVSRNITLTTLACGGNQLTALDVSKNAAL